MNERSSKSSIALADIRVPLPRSTQTLLSLQGIMLAFPAWLLTQSILYTLAAHALALPLNALLRWPVRRHRRFAQGHLVERSDGWFIQLGRAEPQIEIALAWGWRDGDGRPMLGLQARDGRALVCRVEDAQAYRGSLVERVNSATDHCVLALHDYPSWTTGQRALRALLRMRVVFPVAAVVTAFWTYVSDPSTAALGAVILVIFFSPFSDFAVWLLVLRPPVVSFGPRAIAFKGIYGDINLRFHERRYYDTDSKHLTVGTARAVVRVPFGVSRYETLGSHDAAWWSDPEQLAARKRVVREALRRFGFKWRMQS